MTNHKTNDPLVAFLYLLLRDHMTAGAVEGIMVDHIEGSDGAMVLTNGYVAQHAEDVARRLRRPGEA